MQEINPYDGQATVPEDAHPLDRELRQAEALWDALLQYGATKVRILTPHVDREIKTIVGVVLKNVAFGVCAVAGFIVIILGLAHAAALRWPGVPTPVFTIAAGLIIGAAGYIAHLRGSSRLREQGQRIKVLFRQIRESWI